MLSLKAHELNKCLPQKLPALFRHCRKKPETGGCGSVFEHGEGLVQLSHQVLIFPTADNVTHEVQTAIGVFKKMSIELMQDHLMHLQA